MCAGKFLLWPPGRELGPLFDFCMGISIQHDAGLPPESCNTNVIDHKTFLITGGAGLAVHIEHDTVAASSFPSTSKTKWVKWCKTATSAHQTVVGAMAGACTGPWWCDEVGIWYFRLDGRMVAAAAGAQSTSSACNTRASSAGNARTTAWNWGESSSSGAAEAATGAYARQAAAGASARSATSAP